MEEAMIKGINVLAYKTNFNLAYPYYDKKVKEVGGNGSLCFGRC